MQIEKRNRHLNMRFLYYVFKLLVCVNILSLRSLADGTKQASPLNSANGTALFINPATTTGSYFGAANYQRIQFTISDHTIENLYFGLHPRTFSNFNTTLVTNAYYRIYDSNDNLVAGPIVLPTSGAGFISSYSQAVAGPNIGGATPTGYSPLTFDPLGDGDYYVVLYRSTTGGTTMDASLSITFPFFDFTVSTDSNVQYSGRLWCKKWSFVSCDITNVNFPNTLNSSIIGHYFGYTPDQFVVDVQFQSGFRPLGFDLAFTNYGVTNNGNFLVDRKSVNTNLTVPTFANGYKIFLTRPDVTEFPDGAIGSISYSGNILGCPGSYYIPYFSNQPGDVSVLLDLDGVAGYNIGTSDVILESYGAQAGSNVVSWNGNDGLGVPVGIGSLAQVTFTLYQGRTNLPFNDAELNTNGLTVGAVYPANGSRKMFWDDSSISSFGTCGLSTNNVTTGGANISGLYNGLIGPNHSWDGSNPGTTVPALSGGQGSSTLSVFCDDYGNTRAINTWFYANDVSSPIVSLTITNCDLDLDNDASFNTLDFDDDNDGIPDSEENGALTDALADDDIDGIPNYIDNSQLGFIDKNFDSIDDQYDIDTDGILNSLDLDSDNDGLFDVMEAEGLDSDENGILDGFTDANNNGLNDLVDPATSGIPLVLINTEAIGGPNFLDIDSDGDGIVDNIETQITIGYIAPTGIDTDKDGIDNSYDIDNGGIVIVIANSDGIDDPDYLDLNSDNDFYFDAVEGWDNDGDDFADVVPSGMDLDNDGLDDNYDTDDFAHNPTNGQSTLSFPNLDDSGTIERDWREFAAILNFPPTAVNDSITINEEGIALLNVTFNDSDSDGTIDVSSVDLDPSTPGIQNSLSVSGEGNYSVDNTGLVTFIPLLNFNGIATPASYRLKDNLGAISNFATINVTILSVNDDPIAEDDTVTTNEDTSVVINIIDNDSDIDGNIDLATIDLDTSTIGIQNIISTAEGSWTADNLGNITFNPTLNYNGIASATYIANDNEGATTNIALITITITPINDTPVLDNELVTFFEDGIFSSDLTDIGDNDVEGNLIANQILVLDPANGSILVNLDGTFSYTPNLNFNGSDTIVVEICDQGFPLPITCLNDTIFISIIPLNDGPVLDNENLSVVQNGSFTGDLIDAGDYDPDSTILLANVVPLIDANSGAIIINTDGSYTYTPNLGYTGADTIVVEICDQGFPAPPICSNDTIFIVVASTIPPVADNNTANTSEENDVTFNITNTDTDVDGTIDVASVDMDTSIAGIQNSILTLEGNWIVDNLGNLTYSPTTNFNGVAISTYTVNDNNGASSNVAILTINVSAVNDQPVLENENILTSEEVSVSGDITDTGDSDVDGNLIVNTTPLKNPSNGIILINLDGTFSYTPDLNFSGLDTIVAEVCDDGTPLPSLCSNDTIFVTINSVNDTIILDNEFISMVQNSSFNGDLTDVGDNDPDGTSLLAGIIPIVAPSHGLILLNSDGTFTYTPDANYIGSDTVVVQICDQGVPLPAICLNDTLFITISSTIPPVADDNSTTTNEDSFVIFNVTDTDSDIDGSIDPSTVDLNTSASGIQNSLVSAEGAWSVDNLGNVTFNPVLNFNGVATINYTVNDNDGATSNFATLTVTVVPINDNPVANSDNASTAANTAVLINVVSNDTDIDGTIAINTVDLNPLSSGIQTTFSVVGEGNYSVNVNGEVTFTPNPLFSGNTTPINYTVNDNLGATSNVSSITVNVAANISPIANNDTITGTEDIAVSINVTLNDTDADGIVSINTVDLDPLITGIQTTFVVTGQGSYSVNNFGIVLFTPFLNFNGSTTPLNYTISDNLGATSNIATITITLNPANDFPTAVNDTGNTLEDTPVTINIAANDVDVDGNISLGTVDLNTFLSGIQNSFIVSAQGTYSVDFAGELTFSPFTNFNGVCTLVNYTIQDSDGLTSNIATIIITVSAVNDPPFAVSNSVFTNEDVAVTINIVSNDSDPDGTINIATVDLDPATTGIQTTFTIIGQGTYVVNLSGVVTFTPVLNFNGIASSINYTVQDNSGAISNIAIINITVISINDAPIAISNSANTNEDTPVTFNVTTNDTDIDGIIDVGTVDLNPGLAGIQTTFTVSGQGTFTADASGQVLYTPFLNFNGTTTPFTYTVNDNNGTTSNAAAITVTVNPVNDPPIAINNSATTNEDTPISFNIITNDFDIDGTITGSSVDLDPITTGLQNTFVVAMQGDYIVDNTGLITFTPVLNFNGVCTPINYTVQDNNGEISNVANITITINSTNDSPFAFNDIVSGIEDNPTVLNLAINDLDIDGTIALNSIDLNTLSAGTQTIFEVPNEGVYSSDNFGNVVFTPNLNFNGICTPINYTIKDNQGATSNTASISIVIDPLNDPPNIFNEIVSTSENTTLNVNSTTGILSNGDFDIDGSTLTLNTIPVVSPLNGLAIINIDGSYSYIPNNGFIGQDQIVVQICDNGIPLPAICNNDTIFITVSNSLPPVTFSNNYSLIEDNILTVSSFTGIISNGDFDPEAQTLTVNTSLIDSPVNGVALINPDGSFIYTPDQNFFGTDTFVVSVCDPQLVCTNDTIYLSVSGLNDSPIAEDDFNSGDEDTNIEIDLITNDSDVDGTIQLSTIDLDPLSLGLQNSLFVPGVGTYEVDVNGILAFAPGINYNGASSISYTVQDDLGTLSNIATISIVVFPINDPPVIENDEVTIDEDSQAIGDITGINDFDIDTTLLIVNTTPFDGPFNGEIFMNDDGTYIYTPYNDFFGSDQVVFEVCDSGNPLPGICSMDTLVINVVSVNDSVLAFDDNYSIEEDVVLEDNLSFYDFDPDAVELFYEIYLSPTNGTLTLNTDGSFEYIPEENFNGTDSFLYIVCDDGIPTLCDTALVTIDITPINDSIITLASFVTLYAGTSSTNNPNDNNIDPDNDIDLTSFTIIDDVNNGTININADGSVTYTPNEGFIGTDTLYTNICDLGDPIYCSNDTIIYSVIQGAVLGIAKSVTGNQIQLDGSYNIELTIIAENLGNEILANIQLEEDLILAFPLPTTFSVFSPPVATGNLIANSSFNGNGDIDLLVSSVSNLLIGQSDTIRFTINVVPNGNIGPFNNSIFGSAFGIDSEVFTTDVSTDGNDSDPNNDSIPNEQVPTIISFNQNYSIGIAKTTNEPELQLDGSYNLTLTFDITNYGNVEATNIQATDNLMNTFTGTATFGVTFVQVLGGSLDPNTNFNGVDDINLLNSAESSLLPGESEIINVILNFNPNSETGPFYNTALATISNDEGVILFSDSSVNGTNPDPDGNGIPNEESVTPILFSPIPSSIGLSKALSNVEALTDSTFNLTFAFIVENFGNTELNNIQVTDDLQSVFPFPATYSILSLTSNQLQINNGFNGDTEINLLANGLNNLVVDESDTIILNINLRPNAISADYFNSAIALSFDDEGNIIASDNSVDGFLPDPNNDSNPDENSVTPISVEIIPEIFSIGLAKQLLGSENVFGGRVDLTYRFYLQNFGNSILNNIQVIDSLDNTFGTLEYTVQSVSVSESLEANINFNGQDQAELLDETQSSLEVGATAIITLVVRIQPININDTLNNISTVTCINELGALVASDISVNGSLPDPNNDGIPNESSPTPYIITENVSCLGVAKSVVSVNKTSNNSYDVVYKITLENFCSENLNQVQVIDDLNTTFGNPSSFSIVSNVSADDNLTVNQNFDGASDINLLSASNSFLPAGFSREIVFTINVVPDSIFIPGKVYAYSNIAIGFAITISGFSETDTSVDGTIPDPDGNGNPSENNPSIFTIINSDIPPTLTFTDAFSPNNDGINDVFVIEGLTYFYPQNNLKVFNRWGNLIFEEDNYQNDWGGIADKNGIVLGSDKVPEGTYFYLLDIKIGKVIEGFIVIKY